MYIVPTTLWPVTQTYTQTRIVLSTHIWTCACTHSTHPLQVHSQSPLCGTREGMCWDQTPCHLRWTETRDYTRQSITRHHLSLLSITNACWAFSVLHTCLDIKHFSGPIWVNIPTYRKHTMGHALSHNTQNITSSYMFICTYIHSWCTHTLMM